MTIFGEKIVELVSGFADKKNPRGWQLPFCSHASKIFLNVVAPWSVHVCQILSRSVKVCWSYSRKIVFFRPRNRYNIGWSLYTGFQRRDRIDSALTFWPVGQCAVYGGIMTSRPAALSEIKETARIKRTAATSRSMSRRMRWGSYIVVMKSRTRRPTTAPFCCSRKPHQCDEVAI